MLEIFILIALCRRIGAIVEAKGRKKGGYQLMLVLFWFGGEFTGGIAGAIGEVIISGGREPGMAGAYVCALLGAALGAFLAFTVAKSVAPLEAAHAADYDYPDDWPAEMDDPRSERPSARPGSTDITDRAPRPSSRLDDRIRE